MSTASETSTSGHPGVALACLALAESITGLEHRDAPARIDAVKSRLLASVGQMCAELKVEADEFDQVAGCIRVLAAGVLNIGEEVGLAQFAGGLRTLLHLTQAKLEPSGELMPFLEDLCASASLLMVRSKQAATHAEAEQRSSVAQRASQTSDAPGGARETRAADAGVGGRGEGLPVAEVPQDWEVVSEDPPVWVSRVFRAKINQARQHDWCTEAAVLGQRTTQGMEYVVQACMGKGECAALIRGESSPSEDKALESAMRMIEVVPDEPAIGAKAFVRDRVAKEKWPEVVTLSNRVEVGVPRFVASAWWPHERDRVMSTPMMATRRAALEALVHRIEHEKTIAEVPVKNPSPDAMKRLAREGVRPTSFRVMGEDGNHWYEVTWKLSDGTAGRAQSEKAATKWEAMESLMRQIKAFERSAERDWRKVAGSLIRSKSLGEVTQVSFEPATEVGQNRNAGFVCKVGLSRGAIVRGDGKATKLEALECAVGQVEALALKLGDSSGQNEADVARKLREALAQGRGRWVAKRAGLLRDGGSRQADRDEIRDLNWLIALAEGGRAQEVPPAEAERLLRRVAAESMGNTASASIMSPPLVARVLRSMSGNGLVVAGALALKTGEFASLCGSIGWDERRMMKELSDRRLINLNDKKVMRFAKAGEQLAVKHVDQALSSGVMKLASKF